MEAEIRAILYDALGPDQPTRGLGTRLRERFATGGGVELELPPRHELPRAGVFER